MPRPDRVHLYRRDARQVLRALPARSIGVFLTDPPYDTVARQATSGHLRAWFRHSLSWPEIGRALALARARMAPDGVALVMTNGDGLRPAITALERAGFVRVRVITWDKRAPGLGGGLRHQTEYVLVGYLAGSRTLAGVDLVSVAAVGPGTAGRYPTQKPEALGRRLAAIAQVRPGELVVDPFCGSGALLVGALERGAIVVGSDVATAAIKAAAARLSGGDGAASRVTGSAPQARAPSSLDGRRRRAAPTYRNSARGSTKRPRRKPA